ncbi:diphosphate--fructose-6-phosphate 1-phosphotransferase [candidate division KSB3 bacterium]|uniref:ATP-dependent 6-phosphofructokinase n=1 Tax=candidate division KSB3 bacterium TaxID=2044937 RepID=A0A2G6E3B3_9BACT|nr:MAG: diphosphate--fructose-6-phosphate 1-phosphotransferase [candidate division KSB3 bacterium]PIE29058.1 MAG: diphosphate--fructose-6-phosphate 1-phosphotransferase [candidate division KSB3 bacterium]
MPCMEDFRVKTLGECLIDSPLEFPDCLYVSDDTHIRYAVEIPNETGLEDKVSFEKAGPRRKIFFDPLETKAAIVTCGGISPGLNDVIRSLVMQLSYKYNVRHILGIRYGYKGLNPANWLEPMKLHPEDVERIHEMGGTLLGSSRGHEKPEVMVDTLEKLGINILFCIGGDGTLKGAHTIAEEAERRGRSISIVGIPKTIDNDIGYVAKTFGFDTAVSEARGALQCAHIEAKGAQNGIGLVKVMGRDSGFIAANATLANLDVNFTLIPEVPFDLYGKNGFLDLLEQRLKKRQHAVIVVAEGAGQEFFSGDGSKDASGNILHNDIGILLKEEIKKYFHAKSIPVTLKYIDPSYMIRSVPANASDSIFCAHLGRNAVHAAMAGKTDMIVGRWHDEFTHVPIPVTTSSRKKISPEEYLWLSVLESTGQPISMKSSESH